MQQALQIQIGVLADKLQVEAVGLADGLATVEGEYLQVVIDAFDGEAEMGFIGRVEHGASLFPCHPWARPNQRCSLLGAGRRNISSSWVKLAVR